MLDEVDEEWLARRYYGGDLPPEAERCLHLAAASHADTPVALAHLARAAEIAPGHRLVDLGHYKFHFYKADLEPALVYGERMIGHAMAALGVNHADWRAVTPATADFRGHEPAPRLFLFALVAVGYLLLRCGRLAAGREALGTVCTLDPEDRFGAARLIAVADRHEADMLEEASAEASAGASMEAGA
ncbi:hypothetical protein [Azospirillum picis]|uniref:Tetratricopeptide repeat protein n=1 Tax=Azospirillum picis TaxID=488438 RepID=A0ABU0MII4_9PROT|nr:hypothetical protein [Azospirillum picis]MBP2299645.1 hypothetical protein [Azospirillum picis]MDQ0533228.1 hypothetical protein [Azospirillum picis]